MADPAKRDRRWGLRALDGPTLARFIHVQLALQERSYEDLCSRSRVGDRTLRDWKTRANPNFAVVDRVLHELGFLLEVGKRVGRPSRLAGAARTTPNAPEGSTPMSNPHPHRPAVIQPTKGHPVIRFLFREIDAQQATLLDVEKRSGIPVRTIRGWRNKGNPLLMSIEATLHALGYELVIRQRAEDDTLDYEARMKRRAVTPGTLRYAGSCSEQRAQPTPRHRPPTQARNHASTTAG